MRRALGLAALVASLLLPAWPAGADHVQTFGSHALSFDHRAGNEWWVEVVLGGASKPQVTKVEAMDTNGPWTTLQAKSWGAWAASFHLEPGHQARFRATLGDGTQATSCWFTHPAGVEQCSAPPPGAFSATLSNVKGNAWWVQAGASGSRPIAGVDARVGGGAWVAMQDKGWGWAVSTHAPYGSLVQFRVRAADGALFFPPNGWFWTDAREYPSPGPTFNALFDNAKGNANWVQVNVYALSNWGLSGVQASVDQGAWRTLTRQSYRDWTTSTPVPDGSFVQFRACSGSACHVSGRFLWPSARPEAWPVPGTSYARYHAFGGGGSPSGDVYDEYDVNATFAFRRDATWRMDCAGTEHHHDAYANVTDTYRPIHVSDIRAPPSWGTNVAVGENVTGETLGGCDVDGLSSQVVGTQTVATKQGGRAVNALAWHAHLEPCPCASYDAQWARHHGLLLTWGWGGLGGGQGGALLDTDAPIT
ncbi:MAG: hypothetical protein LC624_05475 [Halobacteriales archaeon]|nr:hypothetical protein [Halobacteriales archaeon]